VSGPAGEGRPSAAPVDGAIEAGWVAYGKLAGDTDDYRVLRASRAYFSRADYDAILRRFTPGTPPPRTGRPNSAGLPWVIVSYAPLRSSDPRAAAGQGTASWGPARQSSVGESVLGLALCDWTDLSDVAGRSVAGTAYLCAPFSALAAAGAATYQFLYSALRTNPQVTAAIGQPSGAPGAGTGAEAGSSAGDGAAGRDAAVRLGAPQGHGVDQLAKPLGGENFRLAAAVAGLLLCQPVALVDPVGAGQRPARDETEADRWARAEARLAFLDAVAALLPYGQRARLVASTWADSATEHRIRLAYTDQARQGDAAVRLAGAGRAASLPAMPYPAADYFELLVELRERRGIPVERIITHLAEPPYRQAHRIADPTYALLCLADLPGPSFFASRLLTSARARNTALQAAAVATVDPTRRKKLKERAALEDAASTVAMLRAQWARGRLLAGPATATQDAEVLAALAGRGGERLVARELVRLAVEDDQRAADAGRAGTGSVPAHSAGWLAWLAHEPSLVAAIRPFTDTVAGSPSKEAFAQLLSDRAPWGDTRYALTMLRLARLSGCSRALHQTVWRWLRGKPGSRLPFDTLSPQDRAAWAQELALAPAGLHRDEAELDLGRLLLGEGPVEPLRARMTALYWREYRGSFQLAYKDLSWTHGIGVVGLPILVRVMDGLAGSLDRDGWPDDPEQANGTLVLLAWLVDGEGGARCVSDGLRETVTRYLNETPKSSLYRATADRWREHLKLPRQVTP